MATKTDIYDIAREAATLEPLGGWQDAHDPGIKDAIDAAILNIDWIGTGTPVYGPELTAQQYVDCAKLVHFLLYGPAVGDRVSLHPGLDLWMQGYRFGTVAEIHTFTLIPDTYTVIADNPLDPISKRVELPLDRILPA